jgi:hypothetical protein
VARALPGPASAETTAWVAARIDELRTQVGGPVRAALATALAPTAEAQAVLRSERGYFATNAARMEYPTLADRGLLVDSGPWSPVPSMSSSSG